MLGKRFLLLTHTGRKSGLQREAVLEVVDHDPETGTFFITSGWGERSDWLKNISQNPDVRVQVGNRRFKGRAERLPPDEASKVLVDYAKRHPAALRSLARALGYRIDGVDDARELGRIIPIVALHPTDPAQIIS
jgi:deazaflavin-dependent oxidoreductase (nitroreductase family)